MKPAQLGKRGVEMKDTHLLRDRQTVKLGLVKVVKDMFPDDSLKTTYSVQEGVFCRLSNSLMSKREVKQVGMKLNEWVESNSPIEFLEKEEGLYKYRVGDIVVKTLYPANSTSAKVEPFCVIPFSAGFIVDFGDIERDLSAPLISPDKLSSTYDKYENWLRNINMEMVSDINDYITSGRSLEIVEYCGGFTGKRNLRYCRYDSAAAPGIACTAHIRGFFSRENNLFQKTVHSAAG